MVEADLKVGHYKRREGKSRSLTRKMHGFGMTCLVGRKLAVAGFGVVVEGFEQFVGANDLAIARAGDQGVAFQVA